MPNPTLNITDDLIIMRKDGETLMIDRNEYPATYVAAGNAAMRADFDEIERLALNPLDEDLERVWDDVNDAEEDPALSFNEPEDLIAYVRDMIEEGVIDAGMLGIEEASSEGHEHDLSNWRGSPIFYPTAEMAIDQANKSYGFWSYHDFGGDAPNGYRYATVPNGVGPYAPEGYDWVCLRRTTKGL